MMKKTGVILIVCFLLNTTASKAQLRLGALEGIVTSQVSGDAHAGFHKYGMVGGLFARQFFNKVFSVQVEAIYKEKGSRYYAPAASDTASPPNPFYTPPTYGYLLRLHYIEIPVMMQYNIVKGKYAGLTFEVGTGYGFLVHSEEYKTVPGYNVYQYGPPFKYRELSYNVGIGYVFPEDPMFGLTFRFSRSITSVRDYMRGETTTPLTPGQQNTSLSLTLTYQLSLIER